MPVPTPIIRSGMRVVFAGDSISGDRSVTDAGEWGVPMLDTLAAVKTGTGAAGVVSGGVITDGALVGGATAAETQDGIRPDVRWTGVPGQQSSQLLAGVNRQVLWHVPELLFVLIGVNDAGAGVALATFTANVDATLAAIRAWSATLPIVLLSTICLGEQHDGVNFIGAGNAVLDGYNGALVTLAATYSCTYADVRAAFLAAEKVYNVPPPGALQHVLTMDVAGNGIHPSHVSNGPGIPTGRSVICDAVLPLLTIQ